MSLLSTENSIMKLTFSQTLLLICTFCFGQKSKKIDSLLASITIVPNYTYNYNSWNKGIYSDFDFHMDTVLDELLKVTTRVVISDTFYIDYYFFKNYLVKVVSSKSRIDKKVQIGSYYFEENILVIKKGKNIRLEQKGIYKKISPKYINKQLAYPYYQFEYLNLSFKNESDTLPPLLKIQSEKIKKRNDTYKHRS